MTVSKRIRDLVDARVKADVDKINAHYNKSLTPPRVLYDAKGGTAGYVTPRDSHTLIHLNPQYFINDEDEMINCTTPHELAHWAEHKVFGGWERIGRSGKRSVHGTRWKSIMKVLGADDSRTHSMDTTHVTRKTKRKYEYICQSDRCGKSHTVSSVIHNRIVRGTHNYRCNCGGILNLAQALGKVSYAEAARKKAVKKPAKKPAPPKHPTRATGNQTKKARATIIYNDIVGNGHGRAMCIQRFIDVLDMSKAGATTYYNNCKNAA